MTARPRLGLVSPRRVPCWPWHARFDQESDGHPIGGECADCGCDVALPRQLAGSVAVCVGCALDSGLLPAVERLPHDDDRTLVQVAADWACQRPSCAAISTPADPPAPSGELRQSD